MKISYLFFVALFFACQLNGQVTNLQPSQGNSTGASGTGANINVKYHKISWRINPDSIKYVKGCVQTNFFTIVNNVSVVSFDLNDILTVDSVRFHHALLPAANITRSSNIVSINLGTTLANATLDSIWIYYQGVPPAPAPSRQGYQKGNDSRAGDYITTLSESYEDRDWWPCKADMQDKIDSMDIDVSVPWVPAFNDTFWVASNGILTDSSISGNDRNFHYKSRYPIASYLVFVSVARYNRYYPSPVNISGTPVPVVYDLLAGKSTAEYDAIVTAMNKVNLVLSAFSTKFGDYPFKREKHGFYDGLIGAGGMEHQTFSGIASGSLQSVTTLSHELMHQWFGDNVTFSTWNDLWLAEGFADYAESEAAEFVPSLGLNPLAIRVSTKSAALNANTASAWIPDANIQNSNLIWSSDYGNTVYVRGGMIVSMLRAISGDAKFFQALTNYQNTLAGKSATADSLKNFFNTILGQDLTPFFNDYVGGSGSAAVAVGGVGNPIYSIGWGNPSGYEFTASVLSQTRTAQSNVAYFRGPVALHIKGITAVEDTSIVFFDWGNGNLSYAGNGLGNPVAGNLLTYHLSFMPVSVLYDDSSKTLSTGSVSKITVVNVQQITKFTGHVVNNVNQIDLSFVSNTPASKVELYRSSDGTNFTLAGQMNFTNSTAQTYNYIFTDSLPATPTTFYRSKVYFTNSQVSSNDIQVTRDAIINNNIKITPNPGKDIVTIGFSNPNAILTNLRLISADGKKVASYKTSEQTLTINVSSFSSGMYVLQLFQANKLIHKTTLLITRK